MSASADDADTPASLESVVVTYGNVRALDGVDFALDRGAITVLLGPNGAGKTSAVRLLLGMIRPQAGIVRVFGQSPHARAARQRIGAMLQVSKVPETLRVTEHIDTFRAYYPKPLARDVLVQMAGLNGLERRLFGRLSGGEKQRLLFALALAGDPDLLFLDEPTVGMDVESRRAFWQNVRSLRDAGRAVLLTTHYLDEADALADRIIVLRAGRVVADAPPAVIRRTVARRSVRCTTSLDIDIIRALPGVDSVRREGTMTTIVTPVAEDVLRVMLARDEALQHLEVGGAGLEDAFLELTRSDVVEAGT